MGCPRSVDKLARSAAGCSGPRGPCGVSPFTWACTGPRVAAAQSSLQDTIPAASSRSRGRAVPDLTVTDPGPVAHPLGVVGFRGCTAGSDQDGSRKRPLNVGAHRPPPTVAYASRPPVQLHVHGMASRNRRSGRERIGARRRPSASLGTRGRRAKHWGGGPREHRHLGRIRGVPAALPGLVSR
jgi:hypothetical protein